MLLLAQNATPVQATDSNYEKILEAQLLECKGLIQRCERVQESFTAHVRGGKAMVQRATIDMAVRVRENLALGREVTDDFMKDHAR
eukprot:5963955-Alexandrium_andersonii.AAC.1